MADHDGSPPGPARVTMRQVADAAGVSIATASRALSGRRSVDPELVKLVERASRQLGYRANGIARALRTQSTGMVGMVIPQISNPFFPGIVEVVEYELRETGRSLMLCDSHGSVETESERITSLLEHRVDGLLVVPCDYLRSADALNFAAAQVPIVQIDRYAAGAAADFVGVDNEAGIREVVAHLRSLPVSTLAYVGGGLSSSPAAERAAVYEQSVSDLSFDSAGCVTAGDNSIEAGRTAARRFLASGDLPDAIVCGSDVIALGLLAEFAIAGVGVPDEVLITGFDDIDVASIVTPALTTVRQPSAEIAREAVRMLGSRLAGTHPMAPRRTIIRPHFVRRASA